MVQWINKEFVRPAREIVQRFEKIPTSILSDCMNRFQGMDAGIKRLQDTGQMCGVALTVQSMAGCNWASHQALALADCGDVLVIDARGDKRNAVWGHVMTVAAMKRGLNGVVIDGCIRDGEENHKEAMLLFCRGICPSGPHKGWPENIGVPISCGGVPVNSGDIVVGDGDGVVVVPQAYAEQVLAEAKKRMDQETDWYRRLDRGETTASILKLGDLSID